MTNFFLNFFILITSVIVIIFQVNGSNIPSDLEICSHWNGRRHFLELGSRGVLHGFNTTVTNVRSASYTLGNGISKANLSATPTETSMFWYQCNLELVTCAECVIRITFTFANFSRSCSNPNNLVGNPPARCPCEHIYFTEPPYDSVLSGQYFCGNGKVLRSRTRTLSLRFVYRDDQRHTFSLQYISERNVKFVSGTPKQQIVNNSSYLMPQVISTPFFPTFYPTDYGVEHILSCDTENCHVRLSFTDFQLGITSSMEVFDSNGQIVNTYTGENFRPPIMVSTGKSFLLRFTGNGATGLGYRAEVTFVSDNQLKDRQTFAYTDCGGMVTGPGGAITMMNMIENSTEVRFYDCIWLLKPFNVLIKTHLSLRVDAFFGMAQKSELVILKGITSNGPEIETLKWPNSGISNKNHIIPVAAGFYVRLRGVFGMASRLAIVYSVFNYMNCYIGSEFLCQNNHCISIRLHCDGFDHCGDNSDEPDTCDEDWANVPVDRRWYSRTPNYYFPKIERYPDLKTATGIFIMSALGLLLVISGWLVILYRLGVRARHQRELQNHLQTISELLDRQEELPIDEPPDYEAPPDYEQVIKVGMDDEMNTPNRRQRHRHKRNRPNRSRSRSGGRRKNSTVTDENTPCSSGTAALNRSQIQAAEQLQDIANQVLTATSYCEVTEASTRQRPLSSSSSATTKRYLWRDKGCQTSTPTGSASNTFNIHNSQPDESNYSLCTTSQEESSAQFRDDSLKVSFSLSIPKTSRSENLCPNIHDCTENTHLKKSVKCFHNGESSQQRLSDIQKLRQTFSTPETFLDILTRNEMSYGPYLRSERNSGLSYASTFGSDLPPDTRGFSSNHINRAMEGSDLELDLSDMGPSTMLRRRSSGLNSGYDSDFHFNDSIDISCFGNVNLFGGNRRNQKTDQHFRSRSFNQNDHGNRLSRTRCLKRCLSADLLIIPKKLSDVGGRILSQSKSSQPVNSSS